MQAKNATLMTLLSALVLALPSFAASGPAERTRPQIERPAELRRSVNTAPPAALAGDRLERSAVTTARRAAERAVERDGLPNYFRVGLHQGMRAALSDDLLGVVAYEAGRRDGRGDREARLQGRELGLAEAMQQASALADEAVEIAFRQLDHAPIFDAQPLNAPALVIDYATERPLLDVFFDQRPLGQFIAARDLSAWVDGWGWDARRLAACADYNDFYVTDWTRATQALNRWQRRHRAELSRLPIVAQRRLENRFLLAYERTLDRADRRLARAWERGQDLGWAYGAALQSDRQFKLGFADGFDRTVVRHAQRAFDRSFATEYANAYAAAFQQWETQAVVEIVAVRLFDEDGDDVFEPGESISLDLELVNFGGAATVTTPQLLGNGLLDVRGDALRVAARTQTFQEATLQAAIDPTARPRTTLKLGVAVDDAVRDLDLQVRRPLEMIAGSLRMMPRGLEGRLRVEIDVQNISLRDRPMELLLSTRGVTAEQRQQAPLLAAKERRMVQFELEALPQLDLIAGDLGLDLALQSDGVLQDQLRRNVPGTALDLSSGELSALFQQMLDQGASIVEADRMRELWLQRLRVDWRASVRARGNPYKRDFKGRGTQTALGDLVQLAAMTGTAGDPLLVGLEDDVMRLARDLPGPHPLLRKYVRRLAKRLPS